MKPARTALPLVPATLALAALLTACGKQEGLRPTPPVTDHQPAATARDEDSLKYLMYHIMQVSLADGGRDLSLDLPSYYWYDQVPVLDPLGSAYPLAEDLLAAMRAYPAGAGGSQPLDRYSFLDRDGSVSASIEDGVVDARLSGLGTEGYFGMEVAYTSDLNHLVVLYVDRNGPAGQQGIRRGWTITAVNGDSRIAYDGPNGSNVTRISQAIYGADPLTLSMRTREGVAVTAQLAKTSYTLNPLLFDTVYIRQGRKIGYMALYTFTSIANAAGAPTHTREILDDLFSRFQGAGISDLIVDLRYNGGGAVSTAEYLCNHIAPAAAGGQVMYRYRYNDKMSAQASLLGLDASVLFQGSGGLALEHVFFIVGQATASASELVLNNLKPYMDVKVVGDTTYGKPVGFIEFPISDYDSTGQVQHLADLYAVNFETRNARDEGGYFGGIAPDTRVGDNAALDWGNPADEHLQSIFSYLLSGSFRSTLRSATPAAALTRLPARRFSGMVDYRISRQARQTTP